MTGPGGGRHQGRSRSRRSPRGLVVAVVLVLALATVALLLRGGDDRTAAPADGPTTASPTTPALAGVAADAHRVLTTWARPGTPYRRWWRDLSPLLTPAAQQAYVGTDTALLPDLGRLGEPEVVTGFAPNTSTVWFATDRGRFGVDLSRPAEGADWRMVRVLFPGQDSTFE